MTSHSTHALTKKSICYSELNEQIYAIGGKIGRKKMKSVERYNFEADQLTFVSSMYFERQRHSACISFNKIVVVGGVDGNGVVIHEIECYDPERMSGALRVKL